MIHVKNSLDDYSPSKIRRKIHCNVSVLYYILMAYQLLGQELTTPEHMV